MSEEQHVEAEVPVEGAEPKKRGLLPVIIVGVLCVGGAFGGAFAAAKMGGAKHAAASAEAAASAHAPKHEVITPGPSIALEPFLLTVRDSSARPHAMKVSIAVEVGQVVPVEKFTPFMPRVRDATLGYLRTMSYEEVTDNERIGRMRNDLLEKYRSLGVTFAEHVLITDLVTQ